MPVAETVTRKFRKQFSEENAVAGRQTEACPKPFVEPHTVFRCSRARRWGVILAGGDGTRLRELTRLICGDDRPKQFCPLTSEESLFEQTRKRAGQIIPAEHLLVPLTQRHSAYYLAEQGIPASQRIIQPCNKGTAPPIIHSLLSIEQQDAEAVVAMLPCDHHYADEPEFTAVVERAFEIAGSGNESVILLGAAPQGPEVEYGWIELGLPVPGYDSTLFQVGGFTEKPSFRKAQELFARGSLWNTFVMVGHIRGFLAMVHAALPEMVELFRKGALWSGAETQLPNWLYDCLPVADFSRKVLSSQSSRLAVLRMDNSGWSDLGRPERVLSVLNKAGLCPWWMRPRLRLAFEIDAADYEPALMDPANRSSLEKEVTYGV